LTTRRRDTGKYTFLTSFYDLVAPAFHPVLTFSHFLNEFAEKEENLREEIWEKSEDEAQSPADIPPLSSSSLTPLISKLSFSSFPPTSCSSLLRLLLTLYPPYSSLPPRRSR
jgi:hypothetical protein